MKTLVVAEKPSVGRDIARVLKAREKGDGCLVGENYIVSWAIGHLVTLQEPDELDERYAKWRREDLPILPETIPLKVIKNTASQFRILKKLMNDKEVSSIICATDSGREGELIFRYIYQMAGCKKPFQRLWISSMTDAAILSGFENLHPSADYEGLYASARCRSEADWLGGMNASRAFTLRYGRLLSVGRVQTPTLALIVKRDREISAFVPEDYWEVTAQFENWKGTWFDPNTKETRIKTKEAAEEVIRKTKGKTGTVTECRTEHKRVNADRLYDLTTLQREANRKYGYSAEKTLSLAQALYERHKLLTYPRTDSRYLPDDMKPKIASTLCRLPEPYKSLVDQVKPLSTAERIYDNTKISDHHAIVPTEKQPVLDTLTQEEKNIYDMVCRRLIANHYPAYEYDALSIVTECENEHFKTSLNNVVREGWKAVYAGEKDEKDDKAELTLHLPEVKNGDQTKLKSAAPKQLKTKPPAKYTEDTLLKSMEDAGKTIDDEELREKMKDAGLGTPATRAAIIQRLIQVGYIKREKKTLVSTEKGQKLIEVVPDEMSSALTTGKWERALAKLSRINDQAVIQEKENKFMLSIRTYSRFLTDYALRSAKNVRFPEEVRNTGRKKTYVKRDT